MRVVGVVACVIVLLVALWFSMGGGRAAETRPPQTSGAPALTQETAQAQGVVQDAPASSSAREAVGAAEDENAKEKGIVLAGRVIDLPEGVALERGSGAAGVRVHLRSDAGGGSLKGLGYGDGKDDTGLETTSGADGSFRIVIADEGKRPLSFELQAGRSERFRDASLTCSLKEGERVRTGLVLARRAHGALEGRTVDLAGQAVAGVEVALLGWNEKGEAVDRRVGTAVSDEDGSFRIENVQGFEKLEARKSGFTLIEAKQPGQIAEGGWERCEIVLAGEGTLRLRVSDAAGEPIPRVHVWVSVAPSERHGSQRSFSSDFRFRAEAETDATGTAALPVCAEQNLRLQLMWPRAEDGSSFATEFERVEGERLVVDESESGKHLAVAAGEARDVRVELAAHFRVSGRVVDESGLAPPQAWISLVDLARPRFERGALRQTAHCAADGSFAQEVCSLRPLQRVLVSATEADPMMFSPFGSGGGNGGSPPRSASAVLDFSGRTSGDEHLTLVLEPTLAIAGRIVSARPVSVAVRAHALAGALPFGSAPNGSQTTVYARKNEFRLNGLVPGNYDLEFTPDKGLPTTWVRAVPAGTEDVTVTLEGKRPVRVTVEVALLSPSGSELDQTIVLTGAFRPWGEPAESPELPPSAVYREPFGWPPAMLQLWYGGGGHSDAQGATNFVLVPIQENPTTLELEEGLYWIGAKARTKDGALTFPIGTGLVHLAAGEHRVRFEIAPGAALEGRVTGIPAGEELLVALALADGRLVPLDVGREEMQPMCELGFDGSFRLALVPSGSCELRVGTAPELARGRCAHREELRLEPGEHRTLKIEL